MAGTRGRHAPAGERACRPCVHPRQHTVTAPQRDADSFTVVMVKLERVAPIFGVRDVTAALAYYETLGFRTRSYDGAIYGFATREGIEFHLGSVPTGHAWTRTTAYLYVD